jgi:hypothetical protein
MIELCKKIGFPNEAAEEMQRTYDILLQIDGMEQKMAATKKLFFEGDDNQYKIALEELAATVDINKCTLAMVFLLYCADRMKDNYDERGISEQIYYDTLYDLTYKLIECKNLYGAWGTFVLWWFREFFICERFALGRLQFETRIFEFDDYKGIVKRGDTVYNFHVPSGSPLTYDAVIDSFKRAYKFYGVEGIMPIHFNSWLIYPPHAQLFAKGSNIERFYELFDIISTHEYKSNSELWRVFSVPYFEGMDYSALPENTSLQKSFKKFLIEGGKMGGGVGMILFDGNNIITDQRI